MSVSITTQITQDNATPAVAALMAKTTPERLAKICRDPLRGFWRDHLKQYPRLPGRFAAYPPTGFGEEAADSVQAFAESEGVRLRADKQGLSLRFHGGTIKPVNAKILCFGIAPESYGKTPAEMGFTKGKKKTPEETEAFHDLFAFAKSVTFAPNPAVVPTDDEWAEVAMAAITRSLAAPDEKAVAA